VVLESDGQLGGFIGEGRRRKTGSERKPRAEDKSVLGGNHPELPSTSGPANGPPSPNFADTAGALKTRFVATASLHRLWRAATELRNVRDNESITSAGFLNKNGGSNLESI
jgi:hypothetical protein